MFVNIAGRPEMFVNVYSYIKSITLINVGDSRAYIIWGAVCLLVVFGVV